MKTSGRTVSRLPGKLECHVDSGQVDAIFTWGGKTTSWFPLEDQQPFQLLCYKVYDADMSR